MTILGMVGPVEVVAQGWLSVFWMELPQTLISLGTLIGIISAAIKLRNGQEKAIVVAKATHTLVNSDHGISLRLTSGYTQRIADLTNDPKDHAAAVEAKKAADDHDAAQKTVNWDAEVASAAKV